MVDRMHVPKIWQMEKTGWYRENSVRFIRLTNWRPMLTNITLLGVIPVIFWNVLAISKVGEHEVNGEKIPDYRVFPGFRTYNRHDGKNGGHPADYRGPSEYLGYKDE